MKAVPNLPLPKLSANPRHSIDNSTVMLTTHLAEANSVKKMGSTSARDSTTAPQHQQAPLLLSPRSSFSHRTGAKVLTSQVAGNPVMMSSSSTAAVSPSESASGLNAGLERKKSLRLISAANAGKDVAGSNRLSI